MNLKPRLVRLIVFRNTNKQNSLSLFVEAYWQYKSVKHAYTAIGDVKVSSGF